MNIRKHVFWLIDLIKGGQIRRHFNEIGQVVGADHDARNKHTHHHLGRILQHAHSTTNYYKQFGLEHGLSEFPVINKNIVRENFPSFLSDKYDERFRVAAITSGSTGTPFKVYHDKGKKDRNTADTMFFASLGGYEIGEKLFYFKIWSSYSRKSNLLLLSQNMVPVDVVNLQRDSLDVISKINRISPEPIHLLGFVSAIETLCKALDGKNLLSSSLHVKSIIAIAETLNEPTKAKAEELFNCPVLSRYSNIENGIIAQQTLESGSDFVVNTASYFIEIMDFDRDDVLPHGEIGRIVITDLFNEAMPLIRYDTGDVGVLNEKTIGDRTYIVLEKVEGRKLDQIFDTRGALISSFVVYKYMWNYTELDQYQFIQSGPKDYLLKLCVSKEFNREKQLLDEFRVYLGSDANISVEYVKDIPLLSSGKRKKVVNLMNSN